MLIDGKFSIHYPYSLQNFPPIVILQYKTWKNSPRIFHVLPIWFNIMENKPKFKPKIDCRENSEIGKIKNPTSQDESGVLFQLNHVDPPLKV